MVDSDDLFHKAPRPPEISRVLAPKEHTFETLASSCASLDKRLLDCMSCQTEVVEAWKDMRTCLERIAELQVSSRSQSKESTPLSKVQLPKQAISTPFPLAERQLLHDGAVSNGMSPGGDSADLVSPSEKAAAAADDAPDHKESKDKPSSPKPQVDCHDVHKHWGKRLAGAKAWTLAHADSDPIRTKTVHAPSRHWQEALGKIVRSSQYEACAIALICMHCIYIGLQVELDAWSARDQQHKGDKSKEESTAFEVADNIFLVAFFLEWLLRVLPDAQRFFRGKELAWNWFDTCIVAFMLVEAVLLWSLQTAAPNSQVTLLRLFRIFRIFRVVRIIRVVKSLRELRCMISSIMHALKSLVWTSVVVGMQLYIFGIVLTQGAVDYIYDQRQQGTGDSGPSDHEGRLAHYFGSLERTALTLFQSIATGISWEKLVDVLEPVGAGYVTVLLVFIAVSIFAVMNVVTGVFVSTAIHVAQQDKDSMIQEEIRNKERYLKQMKQVFHEVDTNRSGTLSMEEFEEALQDERVVAYLNAMDLDFTDVQTLFILLDRDTNGTIDIDEFFAGCLRFKGDARSIDIAKLQYELEWVMYNLATLLHGADASTSDLPPTCRYSTNTPARPASMSSLPSGVNGGRLSKNSSCQSWVDSNPGSIHSRNIRGNSLDADNCAIMIGEDIQSSSSHSPKGKEEARNGQEAAVRLGVKSVPAEPDIPRELRPTMLLEIACPIADLQEVSIMEEEDKWMSLKTNGSSKRRVEQL